MNLLSSMQNLTDRISNISVYLDLVTCTKETLYEYNCWPILRPKSSSIFVGSQLARSVYVGLAMATILMGDISRPTGCLLPRCMVTDTMIPRKHCYTVSRRLRKKMRYWWQRVSDRMEPHCDKRGHLIETTSGHALGIVLGGWTLCESCRTQVQR